MQNWQADVKKVETFKWLMSLKIKLKYKYIALIEGMQNDSPILLLS